MLLQIVTTYVDEDHADVNTYEVDLTDKELAQIEKMADPGWCVDGGWVNPVTFREKSYQSISGVGDILADIGKPIKPDSTINVYVY